MPRALTEEEKHAQRERLLEKGKAVVFSHGMRKVSIDDIAGAAGLAKGTFYHHFESKEQYFYALMERLHRDAFAKARQLISGNLANRGDFRANVRAFLGQLFYWPEMAFFIQNEPDIEMLFGTTPDGELHSFKQMETSLFEEILRVGGIDTRKAKPGVVHNMIHALFLIKSSEYMAEEAVQETVDLMLDSLITYIFGGAS